MSAGYSNRPLAAKLGIKSGMSLLVQNAPEYYAQLLEPIPDNIKIETAVQDNLDFIHLFSQSEAELRQLFPQLKTKLAKDGMLWVSWPKKAANVPTDLDGNLVREIGLANGLVDTKVFAVDNIWSGLKFVYRVTDR